MTKSDKTGRKKSSEARGKKRPRRAAASARAASDDALDEGVDAGSSEQQSEMELQEIGGMTLDQDLELVDEPIPEAALRAQAAAGVEPLPAWRPKASGESQITVKLSASLVSKLTQCAQEEGIDLDSFVSEILAEGVVIRAWEIIERKNAMRGNQPGNGVGFNHRGNGHGNGGRRPGRHQHQNYQNRRPGQKGNWMEDRASFLEYVRNQEKRNR